MTNIYVFMAPFDAVDDLWFDRSDISTTIDRFYILVSCGCCRALVLKMQQQCAQRQGSSAGSKTVAQLGLGYHCDAVTFDVLNK